MNALRNELLVEEDDGLLVLTINRPEQKNAMTKAVAQAIADSLDEFDARDDLSVAIVTGAGGTFCSGMDLKRFLEGERPVVVNRGFGGITERPPAKPLIAAVEGYALAGGFEMVLACDLIVAASSAKFGLPEVRRGLVARAGGLLRLPSLIPRTIALELILTGETMDADRGLALGLVNRLVPTGEALQEAKRLGATIAANAPLALRASKQVVSESATWEPAEWFSLQEVIVAPVFDSADAKEGASAFAEKRPPQWSGR